MLRLECSASCRFPVFECMSIDMLGREGRLDECETIIDENNTDVIILMSLLGACSKHNDLERAERVFSKIMQIWTKHHISFSFKNFIYKLDQIHLFHESKILFNHVLFRNFSLTCGMQRDR